MVATPMVSKNSTLDKGTGCTDKQAVITIEVPGNGARTVEAQHYLRSDDGTVSIYLGGRSDGIDIQVHVSRCVIDRVDTHDDTDGEKQRLATDGGRRIGAPIVGRNPDRRDTGNSHWCESRCKTVYCGRLECPYCEASDNDQEYGDDDQELVTDGGYVNKSLDIIEQAGVETGDIVRYDGRRWMVEEYDEWHFVVIVPEGLVPGRHLDDDVYDIVDVRDVERVTDDGDDDSERSLVADGGTVVEPGDVVSHGGEQYRVARVGADLVEVYQLGDASDIVPTSDVESVPHLTEVQD